MKKKIAWVAIITVVSVLLLGSCKSVHHCPAYSQADTEQAEQNV